MSTFLFILLAGVTIALVRVHGQKKASEAALRKLTKEASDLWEAEAAGRQQAGSLSAELATANVRLMELTTELANAKARLARIDHLGVIEDGLDYAARLRQLAEQEFASAKVIQRQATDEVQAHLAQAQAERARLIADGETKAREIAGAAYDLAKQEDALRRTIQALENTIKGYGDEYLVPTSLLLDELEERYGFADVGQSLKNARKRVEWLIKNGKAAACDYVEENRRATAVAFVLDAFNGKVDSVLASVKHDNFGKLQQRVKDAFLTVNHLGSAFRSARVLPDYFDAQLEVLRWAVAAQELKRLEKEEQRALREQMREEEKAQREFERAAKEAARDEEVARKAFEKTKADMEQAGEAERAKYETKLAELMQRLQAAEERGQRALSMAQQTRAGNVYVISNVGSFGEDVYKIGMTRRQEPEDRIKELGDASVPFSFDIHALIRTDDAPTLEKALHKRFLNHQVNKVNPRKEFFRVPLIEIRSEIERMNIQASWTMTAACAEWRESHALSQRIAQDAVEYARWTASQMREHEHAVLGDVETEEA